MEQEINHAKQYMLKAQAEAALALAKALNRPAVFIKQGQGSEFKKIRK